MTATGWPPNTGNKYSVCMSKKSGLNRWWPIKRGWALNTGPHVLDTGSTVKPTPIVMPLHTFSRTLRQLHVITSRSLIGSLYCVCPLICDWLLRVITVVLVLLHSVENRTML